MASKQQVFRELRFTLKKNQQVYPPHVATVQNGKLVIPMSSPSQPDYFVVLDFEVVVMMMPGEKVPTWQQPDQYLVRINQRGEYEVITEDYSTIPPPSRLECIEQSKITIKISHQSWEVASRYGIGWLMGSYFFVTQIIIIVGLIFLAATFTNTDLAESWVFGEFPWVIWRNAWKN